MPRSIPSVDHVAVGRDAASWWRSSGYAIATTPAPTMHARPPATTLNVGVNQAATRPASKSPSRGPPVTTRMKIVVRRPRSLSGVASWAIGSVAQTSRGGGDVYGR